MSTVPLKRCGPSLPRGIPAKDKWEPPTRQQSVRFRPDGQIAEIFDGSNSRTTYTYNQAGQILGTRSESEDGPFKTIYVL